MTSEKPSFRDSISTVDKQGKRVWVYPKKPSGKWTNYRDWLSYFLLVLLFAGPFLRINGQPLLLLDVLNRKFVILGQVFWPQDFHLFVIGMIAMIVFIILFTVAFGRLFCGWVCPQTIFMEMLFRKIEYAIEGDYKHQKRLDAQEWNTEKILKKGSKHLIFYAISFVIANVFLAYLIGSEKLIEIITAPPSEHAGGLTAIMVFSFVFYFVFAKMREQVCTTICPYGRLQGVMLDRHSIIITYDNVRGENRAKWRNNEDRKAEGKGDCIDCRQCVDVCPTGIDIRNGTQLECINCTACIDACNHIMDSVNLKRGLIRYASEEEIRTGAKFTFTKRMMAYTGLLTFLLIVLTSMMVLRTDVDATLLRTPGLTYQKTEDGRYRNILNYKIINKTRMSMDLHLKPMDAKAEIVIMGQGIHAEPESTVEGVFFLVMDKKDMAGISTRMKIGIYDQNVRLVQTVKASFLGPGT
jgi:cytochrome c oxidase accessory protein FixG